MKKSSINSNQSGQVLLILVMILATALSLVFSVSFTSQNDVKTAKLEEESKRALSAAEAILEASLKKDTGSTYTLSDLGLSSQLNGFTGNAAVSETSTVYRGVFTTPLLQKDEQYTYYASNYNPTTHAFSSVATENVYFYFFSGSGCPAVELTYVKNDANNTISKDLIDPCNLIQVTIPALPAISGTYTVNNVNFVRRTTSPIDLKSYKLVFIRVLSNSTKIGIQETLSNNLPSQGKITATNATTSSSVTSSIDFFQSYPQIPSDFFVTRF